MEWQGGCHTVSGRCISPGSPYRGRRPVLCTSAKEAWYQSVLCRLLYGCSSQSGEGQKLRDMRLLQVWRAPEELLQYHQLTHAPAVPSGGWKAAVAAAAAARPDSGADHPIEPALPLATAPHPSVPGVLHRTATAYCSTCNHLLDWKGIQNALEDRRYSLQLQEISSILLLLARRGKSPVYFLYAGFIAIPMSSMCIAFVVLGFGFSVSVDANHPR